MSQDEAEQNDKVAASIPTDLKSNIINLVKNHKNIICEDFEKVYLEEFNEKLKYDEYGFDCYKSLVCEIAEIKTSRDEFDCEVFSLDERISFPEVGHADEEKKEKQNDEKEEPPLSDGEKKSDFVLSEVENLESDFPDKDDFIGDANMDDTKDGNQKGAKSGFDGNSAGHDQKLGNGRNSRQDDFGNGKNSRQDDFGNGRNNYDDREQECFAFKRGECRFGDRCRNKHVREPRPDGRGRINDEGKSERYGGNFKNESYSRPNTSKMREDDYNNRENYYPRREENDGRRYEHGRGGEKFQEQAAEKRSSRRSGEREKWVPRRDKVEPKGGHPRGEQRDKGDRRRTSPSPMPESDTDHSRSDETQKKKLLAKLNILEYKLQIERLKKKLKRRDEKIALMGKTIQRLRGESD